MIPEIKLRPKSGEKFMDGGLWVFRNELEMEQRDFGSGTWVRLVSAKGRPLAVGFLNTRCNLAFRAVAPSGEFAFEEEAQAVVLHRLTQALALRQELGLQGQSCRLVFAEGDRLSGLVVDRFGDVLSVQFNTAGMDALREPILEALRIATACKAIVERSDGSAREKEGLKPSSGLIWSVPGFDEKTLNSLGFSQGGYQFHADLLEGQKTGFFLDQGPARAIAASLAKGKACLDVFCYTGGFSVAMAKGQAASVIGMDASEPALALAKKNAQANGVEALCQFHEADCFKELRNWEQEGRRFGLIVVDPPALARGKEGLEGALRGYRELNLRALRMLETNGYLVTCSCTQAVDWERFDRQVMSAARDARASLAQIYALDQPADHPWVLAMPETRYLKVAVYKKL
jgi:23S rRNA (cytosine1962-C5)-methyltransferase